MKIVFMGTPDFAVPSLKELVANGYDVVCAVTQPDKPKGRGKRVSFSPVKKAALEYGIPVLQPNSLRKDADCVQRISGCHPDIIAVAAFGQILPPNVLLIPKYGCVNVHASLLPKLRGAAPINRAIINGDRSAGITTMLMDEGLDTGDMLLQEEIAIGSDMTAGELHDSLMAIGGKLLVRTLKSLEDGSLKRVPQDGSLSTYAPMIDRDTGRIDWRRDSSPIRNLIRGLNPCPGAYGTLGGKRVKIWRADFDGSIKSPGAPGEVYGVDPEGIRVYTGDGGLIINDVQLEGGRRIDAYSYTLGHHLRPGDRFEEA